MNILEPSPSQATRIGISLVKPDDVQNADCISIEGQDPRNEGPT